MDARASLRRIARGRRNGREELFERCSFTKVSDNFFNLNLNFQTSDADGVQRVQGPAAGRSDDIEQRRRCDAAYAAGAQGGASAAASALDARSSHRAALGNERPDCCRRRRRSGCCVGRDARCWRCSHRAARWERSMLRNVAGRHHSRLPARQPAHRAAVCFDAWEAAPLVARRRVREGAARSEAPALRRRRAAAPRRALPPAHAHGDRAEQRHDAACGRDPRYDRSARRGAVPPEAAERGSRAAAASGRLAAGESQTAAASRSPRRARASRASTPRLPTSPTSSSSLAAWATRRARRRRVGAA